MTSCPDATVDSVLETYRHFMRALTVERGRRGDDPWQEPQMTLPQLRALSTIAASQRGLSHRELAATLSVGASAITPLVDRLVERGFVQRDEDPHDRRIARLHATESGALALERLHAIQTDLMRSIFAQLSAAELQTVGTALDVLRVALERSAAPPLMTTQPAEGIPA
jgi:DNA-binding MarR family transcriptional regulator